MKEKSVLKDYFGDIRQHLMTGISYMLPLIVTYALFMVLGQIPGATQPVFTKISELAQMLIVPVLATYIAYSIGGKPTVATGLVVGLLADQMGMGFIGGLIVGLLTGYFVKLEVTLLNKIKGGHWKDFLVSFLVVPIITPLVLGLFTYFVIGNPVSAFMLTVNDWLQSLSRVNAVILSLVLGRHDRCGYGRPHQQDRLHLCAGRVHRRGFRGQHTRLGGHFHPHLGHGNGFHDRAKKVQ